MTTWRCENLSHGERVRSVNLSLQAGRVTALIGPSGSGKSTLLSLMAGLLPPSAGQVEPCPGRLGMVFQEPSLWDHLKVEQHLSLLAQDRTHIDELLDRMRLNHLRQRRPPQLSGGEKQRLAFARAMAVRPDWLLLDEPTAHLDGANRDEMIALLRETLAETDMGVLWATHESDVALPFSDDSVVLIQGRQIQSGPTAEIYRHPKTLEAARLLGPAFLLTGKVVGNRLMAGDTVLVEGIQPIECPDQETSLIVRPEWLRFTPTPNGSAQVLDYSYQGAFCLIHFNVGGSTVQVQHATSISKGTRGNLAWIK